MQKFLLTRGVIGHYQLDKKGYAPLLSVTNTLRTLEQTNAVHAGLMFICIENTKFQLKQDTPPFLTLAFYFKKISKRG